MCVVVVVVVIATMLTFPPPQSHISNRTVSQFFLITRKQQKMYPRILRRITTSTKRKLPSSLYDDIDNLAMKLMKGNRAALSRGITLARDWRATSSLVSD